ncbi:MAG: hypothetical protein QOE76_3890 [Frankiales bacterium]|nr:hypothetical protein [Frankiales bacterium]MDX6246167.1 hypothetical protein [Frankiales bacterium]
MKPSYPESQSMNRPVPRRAILGSFAAGVGLLGLQGAAAAPAQAARTTPMASQFVLHATGLRTPGGRRPRDVGAHYLVSGALRRSADGPAEGEFFAQATVVDRNHLSTSTPGSLQSHTFVLSDGTLTGTGALDHAGAGQFVVTGGTGAYDGVRGSYTVHQDVDAFSGGAALYSFSLIAGKAS